LKTRGDGDELNRIRGTHPGSRFADRTATGHCLCGAVAFEIVYPAFWAWHDHGRASRLAHGAAYATYVGCWRKNWRITKGAKSVARFHDKVLAQTRSFCVHCGTPILYERGRAPHMVNVPRSLIEGRTGREPRYHLNLEELRDWTWRGEKLVPLKGYPGVFWVRPKSKRRPGDFDKVGSAGQKR
jgi:hypothetical protein